MFISLSSKGQCINNHLILTTDWAVDNQDSNDNKINSWNWTRERFTGDVWVIDKDFAGSSNICTDIPAPWHNSQDNNPNVKQLVYDYLNVNGNVLDIYPVDGWELLTKRMGREVMRIQDDGTSRLEPEPVSNPSFSIYNRRTGHIKVFMYITNTSVATPQSIKIRLAYTENQFGNLYQGAMINHRDSIVLPLSQFKINDVQDVQAKYDGIKRENVACLTNTGYWIMADFWANLDPCSCYPEYPVRVHFEFEFIENRIIQMEIDGDISGSIVQNFLGGSNSNYLDNNTPKNGIFNGILNEDFLGTAIGLKDGFVKAYKGADGFNSFAMKLVKPKVVNGVAQPALLKGKFATSLAAKGAVLGPKGLLVAGAIGLTYSFIKMTKKPKPEKPKPLVFESNSKMNLTANGTISSVAQTIYNGMLVTGSPGQPNGNLYTKPIYNNVLGVFRVTDLPKLQYVKWHLPPYNVLLPLFSPSVPPYGVDHLSTIVNQYKLSDEQRIKYILNPASGLAIETIEAQIVLDLDNRRGLGLPPTIQVGSYDMQYSPPYTGVFQFGQSNTELQYCEGVDDFEKQHTASGLQITNWVANSTRYDEVTVATPFAELPCLHNQSFVMDQHENFNAYIKFHVVFTVANKFGAISDAEGSGSSSNEAERVEYIVTYPLEIENRPINEGSNAESAHFVYKVGGTFYPIRNYNDNWYFYQQFPWFKQKYRENTFIVQDNFGPWVQVDSKEVIPTSILIENTTLSGGQEFKAIENITIGDKVSIINGSNIKFTAGKLIEISENFEGEEMSHFNIGLNPSTIAGICDLGIPYNSTPDLDYICRNEGEYFNRATKSKREETLDNSNREQAELINNIGLFPNPAIESTIINFDIQEDSRISVELLDFKGQVLKKLAENKYYPTGRYEMLVDIKSLSQGIYLISLTDENGFKKVHKLIKQ